MEINFDVATKRNHTIFYTNARGNDILRAPLFNKGSAYTKEERELLSLEGLLPPRILSIEQQIKKIYQRYQRLGSVYDLLKLDKEADHELPGLKKTIDIARYNFLRDLQDRNEILFYAFCKKYLQKIIPIIYTPTVGDAVMRFSRDSARFRGIFLSPNNIQNISSIFKHFRYKKPTIAVVTDNQGILGLGDQGVGGIDIPIGKLSLYVLGAGIPPWQTMPVTLDVGTDNPLDLNDPYYLGYKQGRLNTVDYEQFIERFVSEISEHYPDILIQWEDFSRQNAFSILDNYRTKILSFNDDIQGTGSVALAGILNALKIVKKDLKEQRIVIYGAGAGGVGIARRIAAYLYKKNNLSQEQACKKIILVDSKGLVTTQRTVAQYKQQFSKSNAFYQKWDVQDPTRITLLDIIRNYHPTILIGTSGCAGHFTTQILSEMIENCERPIIFPLSNPTANSETTPQEIYRISVGKGIVATGSPFDPFIYHGKKIVIGQGNNFFIFPGIGLGAILSRGHYIDDEVFTEAAITLSNLTSEKLVQKGTLFPSITNIRDISVHIAYTTIEEIALAQGTRQLSFEQVRASMWEPSYPQICPI